MRMRFTQDSSGEAHRIRSYADGEFHVDEQRIRGGLLVSATELLLAPELRLPEDIGPVHIERILAWQPELVLLGTGLVQRFPAASLAARFWAHGIGFEVMDSGAACRTFNVLMAERRRAVAALLP